MFAIVKNGEIVKVANNIRLLFPNVSFSSGGPSSDWMKQNDVMEVVDGEQMDQRFYWVTPANPPIQLINNLPTRVYINTPKNLEDTEDVYGFKTDGLKTQWLNFIKDTANKLLAATDWYVIRKAERGIEIPDEISVERAKIIAETKSKEDAIKTSQNIDELIDIVTRASE